MTKKKCKKCKWWLNPIIYLGECHNSKHIRKVIPEGLPGTVMTFAKGHCKHWEEK